MLSQQARCAVEPNCEYKSDQILAMAVFGKNVDFPSALCTAACSLFDRVSEAESC